MAEGAIVCSVISLVEVTKSIECGPTFATVDFVRLPSDESKLSRAADVTSVK